MCGKCRKRPQRNPSGTIGSSRPKITRLPRLICCRNKISLVSKNRKTAKEEWRQKQEALKRGQVPTEYKEWLGPKQKKFTSMSTFINDRSLYDEYQNRFRKDSVPKYQPMKKVNHEKMKREVEDREDKFLKVLNNEESRQSDKPNGRKRPITSTQPSKIKNRQIVDYAEESDEETTQTFKTYEDYSRKEYRFNKDLNTSDNQEGDQSGEIDDVIDFMNSEPKQEAGENYGFPIRQPRQEVKKEEKVQEQEYDYLDYQNNIDNLKKITEEQAKFDYLETDLDS